jgi:hypothetical protein
LFGKLRDAKAAVSNGDVLLIDPDVIAEDAIELGYDIGSELLDVLTELLEETSLNHYAGFHPPQRSYKREIEGLELFPFVVESPRFKCGVYFKFALSRGSLWLVSLHEDRPVKESV